jgi:hypothetical protein
MGAGRPIKLRTSASAYQNDVAALTRLRTAVALDSALPRDDRAMTLQAIDALIERLGSLNRIKIAG